MTDTIIVGSDVRLKPGNNRPLLKQDELLYYDYTAAHRFLGDLSRDDLYTAGSPMPNNAIIPDLTGHADGRFIKTGAGNTVITGNGADFAGVTASRNYIEVPASVLGDVAANGGYYLLHCLVKLPSEADFVTGAAFRAFMSAADTQGAFSDDSDAELAQAAFVNYGAPYVAITRQKGLNDFSNTNLAISPSDFGKLAQIAIVYDATGFWGSVRTVANGRSTTMPIAGAQNAKDWSGKTFKFGVCPAGWTPDLSANNEVNGSNFKLYRFGVVSLGRGNPNVLELLDADWVVQAKRNVYS